MKALFIVDLQNDFCPGGALAVEKGDEIVPIINQLINKFDIILASKDWHPESTKHFNKWPVHCVQNSKGAEFHPQLNSDKIQEIFLKGTSQEDDGYSAFEATNISLENYLRSKNVKEIYICGLALDYCVKATAIDAISKGFDTYVVVKGTKAVNINGFNRVVEEIKSKGIKIIE